MARGKKTVADEPPQPANGQSSKLSDYRHASAKRKNNPPAKIAAEGVVPIVPKAEYGYSPRRPPALRFDPDGAPDRLPELLAAARQRPLNDDEVAMLAEALRTEEPWLEWAGKRERRSFHVDPVALHIHERVSAQAILKVAARQDVQRDLFADPRQQYHEAVQFYQHDIDWTNRLILGDSLQVMSSLARREDLAGKVQMIYIDPPYGIKFASNFQPEIGKRDVKDKEQDLTREPEMVKAYRDTWQLGVHSYLSYLRDRLVVAKELLADSGSIFVQISDENLHRVRSLLDEVFNPANFIAVICFVKATAQTTELLSSASDYLLWYSKDKEKIKYHRLFLDKALGEEGASNYSCIEHPDNFQWRRLSKDERETPSLIDDGWKAFSMGDLTSQRPPGSFPFTFNDQVFTPGKTYWKTSEQGLSRLASSGRIIENNRRIYYKRYLSDFPAYPITTTWTDTASSFAERVYVVQTTLKVIQRCLLMTTDPGDLVLDPTCGSGTTAYVAEQWGRRWITTDTSRVALAIARQRLLTAKYDFYRLREVTEEDRRKNPQGTWLSDPTGQVKGDCAFVYKTVPHITLKSIAQNTNLDPIFAKHEPILEEKLAVCNAALRLVTDDLRARQQRKLLDKQKAEGKKAITDADRRRWELPKKGGEWRHWQIPFDADEEWPKKLIEAVKDYRAAWRAKMDEVNECIAANADNEELVDQPEAVKGVVRVSGPFTVEAVQPPEMSLGDVIELEFGGGPEALEETFDAVSGVRLSFVESRVETEAKNLEAYLDQMIRLLVTDGVGFPNNKRMKFTRLEPSSGASTMIHAEGRWVAEGESDADPDGAATVCVAFGPQYGPVTAKQVEELIKPASRRYDDLVIAGFSFDGAAQTVIEEAQHPKLRIHMANIRPDVNPGMNGLLKEQPGSQLFTVFGSPRVRLAGPNAEGEYKVVMEGVDIYNPVDNSIAPTGADKVAAWFLDSDYDGRTFCVTQAFFPDRNAWDKLSKALAGVVDGERFEKLSGVESLEFPPGENRCVAVKVIDPRGNEVMWTRKL